jgi:hypothetical protein
MFMSLVESAIISMIQKWITPPAARESPIHLNEEALKAFAIRVGSLATLCFLNFMLFVGAIIVTAVAAAHSFEVRGYFVATPVFWTGLVMLFTALLLEAICAWALLSTKISLTSFFATEPRLDTMSFWDRIVTPFTVGLAAGLRGEYRSARTAKDRPSRAA